ncbi:hypothetical protein ACFLQK_01495, partial [bacterium]
MKNDYIYSMRVLCLLAIVLCCSTANALQLTTDGESGYAIVAPDDAAEAEKYAATELRGHIEQMSGAR